MKKILFGSAYIFASFVLTVNAQPLNTATAEVIQVRKNQFDRPATPLEVPIVAISGNYAVAGWIQDNRGGRTLLRHDADTWHALMCSGAQFKLSQSLRQACVQEDDTIRISQELRQKEQLLAGEQLKKIDSFQGIMTHPDHHEHH